MKQQEEDRGEEEWKKVGFGWANTGKYRIEDKKNPGSSKVSLLIPSIPIHFTNFEEEFPSRDFYSHLKDSFPEFPIEYDQFRATFQRCLRNYFLHQNPSYSLHYEDFLQHQGISNQRPLRWDIMHIPPHVSFNLHAHPNIEIIWVIAGTIHEYRLIDRTSRYPQEYLQERADKTSSTIAGPNLSNVQDLQFLHQAVSALPLEPLPSIHPPKTDLHFEEDIQKAFIVNEIGSIHLTFTREESATLLVAWSGSHANVAKDQYPPQSEEIFVL